MRTLILLAIVVGPASWAVGHRISAVVEADFRNGPLDFSDLGRTQAISSVSEKVSLRQEGIYENFNTQIGITTLHPDYSSVLIRERRGSFQPLSDVVGNQAELSTEGILEFAKGRHLASVSLSGSLTDSPFAYYSTKAAYRVSFFNQSTNVGLSGAYLRQNQPLSYFTDRDFRNKARPARVHAYEARLSVEQSLSESWKAGLESALVHRQEERPRSIGVYLKTAYALSDTLFAHIGLSYENELSDPLLNERGYFESKGYQVGLTYEPIYDLFVSASYGLSNEREEDPRVARLVQVGSDQYGLGVKYQLSRLEFSLQAKYAQTNTQIKNTSLSGGVTWLL